MGSYSFSISDLPARFAFLDPAGSKKRATGKRPTALKHEARSAIVVVAPSPFGHILVLEAWAEKCTTPELIDKVFATQKKWGLRTFGVEANAMQSLFVESLELIAQMRETKVPLVPVIQPTRIEKDFRIKTALQPLIEGGRLVVGKGQVNLLAELESFPSPPVDLVDALASVVALIPPLPGQVTAVEEERALERYLRSINTPSWYIQERINQLREGGEEDGRPRSWD